MANIEILGTGMAACGAAHRLNQEGADFALHDMHAYPGGHTATFRDAKGFIFDDGPHISFTKDARIQELFARNVEGEYEVIHANVANYWRGHWIKHPAQCNLYGLPPDLIVKILQDFVEVHDRGDFNARNYADWLVGTYGKTFAEMFPMEYGLKYHTTPAENMTTVWLGPRLYRPSLEEILRGALVPQTPDVHYVSDFRYPRYNGFVSYLKPFFERNKVHLSRRLMRLDTKSKKLHFSDGTIIPYDFVISSIPLPDLISAIEGVPADVIDASRRLACSTCVTVNLGIAREDISPAHWTYFYDRDIFFTRLSFPHMLSPNTVPPGHSS
ncbi:MAG TPA: NAD(P)-binding protein, partial [Terrimicrobiaceae bacterium]